LLITKKGHHIKLIRKDEKRAYVQELGQRKILDCSLTMEVTEMAARTYMTKYLKSSGPTETFFVRYAQDVRRTRLSSIQPNH
jgi:hypothetical protein